MKTIRAKKRQRILTGILALGLLLALVPATPALADLTPGHLDTGFDPGTGANGNVQSLAVQPDGKVLIGGDFTTVDGTARNRIARLDADGSLDTGFDPGTGANDYVWAVAVQPDGKVLIGGDFTQVDGVARSRIARLNADGSLDPGFDPGANYIVSAVAVQPDGKVLIGGNFWQVDGVARKRIARLNANGSLDTGFDPGTGASHGPNAWVWAVAVQPDGKVLIGGDFTVVDGVARKHIARLNSSGALDTEFNPGAGANDTVYAVATQADGKVLIGGGFTQVDGVSRYYIARLNSNGSLDTGFYPGAGANSWVWDVAVQPDGKVLIGGDFIQVDGVARYRIARLNGDGSLDDSFDTSTAANHGVRAVAVQPDGKVFVGGIFTQVEGVARNHIARLNADGSLDTAFNAGTGPNNEVRAVVVQPNGKVFVGGFFTQVDGVARNRIARLNGNGALDTGFNPGTGANGWVQSLAVQTDDKVLVGGDFTQVNGVARNRIARLNSSGSLDTGFNPGSGANDVVYAVAVQPDSKVLVGGDFTQVNGVARSRIARLNSNGSLDTGFDPGSGANNWVCAVAVQSDGKVLIGGYFTQVDGVARNRIARLNADGSLDTGFNPGAGANDPVLAVAIQPNNKVLIGGHFTQVNGVACNRIARLNSSGALDTGFNPGAGANGWVYAVAVQADGKVLVGGSFNQIDGTARYGIARLNSSGSLDTGFDPGAGANSVVDDVAVQVDGKVLIGGGFTQVDGQSHNRIARLNGATSPAFTSALPPSPATVGTAYSHTFTASGFPLPTFHVTTGRLPPGLTLNSTSGVLSGTPTAAGTYNLTVMASNYVTPSATQTVSLVVEELLYLPLVLRQSP